MTEPSFPNYTLQGTVLDIDSLQPLNNIEIHISAIQLSYDVNFQPQTTTTNDSGKFSFNNLYIGTYNLTFSQNEFPILQKGYFQTYHDTSLTYFLASPYQLQNIFEKFTNSRFTIYDQSQETEYYSLSLIKTSSVNEKNLFYMKYMNNQWIITDSIRMPVNFSDIALANITFGKDTSEFYLLYSPNQVIYKFEFQNNQVHMTDTLFLQSPGWDIYHLNDTLYISYENKISIYDEKNMSLIGELTASRENMALTSIYKYGKYFWCTDINYDELYQCDSNLNIIKTYIPFLNQDSERIRDITGNTNGDLWFVLTK